MASDSDTQKKLENDKATVFRFILISWVILLFSGLVALYFPFPEPRLPTLLYRFVFTLRWLMLSSVSVMFGVAWIASLPFFTPAINSLDKCTDKYVALPSRYLQDTFEQFSLHFVALLVLTTHVSAANMHLIPCLVVLFLIGRVLFGVGFVKHYSYRALGFALTFYPTVIVYGFCLYCSFAYGFAPH